MPAASSAPTPDAMTPDVQVHFIIFSGEASGAALHPFPGFIASICQLRPESRGFVRIKSADPATPPAIQPRYLSSRIRLRHRRRRHEAVARQSCGSRRCAITSPRSARPSPTASSDADLLAFARATGSTVFHPTSTCRMGSDAAAVVDERLRVRGIERSARGRRLDHADGRLRQYQCRGGDDRRKRRRDDFAGCGGQPADQARANQCEVAHTGRPPGGAISRHSQQGGPRYDRVQSAVRRRLG